MSKKTEKLPALHFYPGDWKRDLAVQSLTIEERGVWLECLFLMHCSDRRGYLVVNDVPMTDEEIARAIASDKQTVSKCLAVIKAKNICGLREDGAIFSRRMVADEEIRAKRVLSGSQGGKAKQKSSKTKANLKENPENENVIESEDVIEDLKKKGLIQFRDFVWLSEIDADSWRCKLGAEKFERACDVLNGWIGQKKDTKDISEFNDRVEKGRNASFVFQNWVAQRVSNENGGKKSIEDEFQRIADL